MTNVQEWHLVKLTIPIDSVVQGLFGIFHFATFIDKYGSYQLGQIKANKNQILFLSLVPGSAGAEGFLVDIKQEKDKSSPEDRKDEKGLQEEKKW